MSEPLVCLALSETSKAYKRTQCMRCGEPPVVDVQWAEGRGRAWFCLACFKQWVAEEARDIVAAWYMEAGEVPAKLGAGGVRVSTSGTDDDIVARVEKLASGVKVRNWWVDDPKSANPDWLKLVPRLRLLQQGGKEIDMSAIINIGDTDENADWIKTEENRARERRIHDALATQHASGGKQRGEGQGQGQPPVGDAGTDYCYCPACRALFEHQRGKPCSELLCTECGGVLRGATEEEIAMMEDEKAGRRVRRDKVSIIERIKKEFADLQKAVAALLSWAKYEEEEKAVETKATKYQVQPFHANFAKADEHAKWAFSAKDGNAILDKGGWQLYKQCHLVANTSERAVPENKGAYTYPVAKLVGGKPTYFLKAAQTVYAGLRGGARGADLPEATNKKVLTTVKKIYGAFGRAVEHMELKQCVGTAFAFKALDGATWWLQFTTNAFRDREGELFTTKALEDYVERHRKDDVKGQFWYRHIPGTKFGDVRYQAMVGRFLVQAGPFDDTPIGRAFKAFFEEHPEGHKEIAPQGWGTSHGYYYDASDRRDGVYNWLEIKESTVLPRNVAANTWSPMPLVIRGGKMNKQEQKELERIGGPQLVSLVLAAGEEQTKNLESAGIAYKAMSDLASRLLAVSEQIEDESLRTEVEGIVAELSMYDVLEEEAAAEATASEEGEGKEMTKVVEEKEVAGEEAVEPLTREEVAEALKSVISKLREEIDASGATMVKAVTETLQPLVAEVEALKRADSEKIAKKAAQTPAASLHDLITSVVGAKEAAVVEGDALLDKGPKETQAESTGLFFEQFLGGTRNE